MSEEDRSTGSHFHPDDDNVNHPLLNDFQEVDLESVDAPPAGNNDADQNIANVRDDEAAPVPEGNPVTGNIKIVIQFFKTRELGTDKHTIYKLETKVNGITAYANENYTTWRRFSDFLGLHHNLYGKYLSTGVLIPTPPPKELVSTDVSKRARLLERFMNRVVRHDPLRSHEDVVEFITNEDFLPRSKQSVALGRITPERLLRAGQNVMGFLKTYEEDGDEWFRKFQGKFVELDKDLHNFSKRIQTLADFRRKTANHEKEVAEDLYRVAAMEDSRARPAALKWLDDFSKEQSAKTELAKLEHTKFLEGIQEYISLISSHNLLFAEREETWQKLNSATKDVNSKKAKKEIFDSKRQSGKSDQMTKEIEEATAEMYRLEQNFDEMSKAIKEEVKIFFIDYTAFMKSLIIPFCEDSIWTTDQMVVLWREVETTAKYMYSSP